jgi:hypothetical protein
MMPKDAERFSNDVVRGIRRMIPKSVKQLSDHILCRIEGQA